MSNEEFYETYQKLEENYEKATAEFQRQLEEQEARRLLEEAEQRVRRLEAEQEAIKQRVKDEINRAYVILRHSNYNQVAFGLRELGRFHHVYTPWVDIENLKDGRTLQMRIASRTEDIYREDGSLRAGAKINDVGDYFEDRHALCWLDGRLTNGSVSSEADEGMVIFSKETMSDMSEKDPAIIQRLDGEVSVIQIDSAEWKEVVGILSKIERAEPSKGDGAWLPSPSVN